ncbi:DUF1569 domain-containing protein [Arenibacter sp. TNZ]|jgi:hypothetical protein|uniref:DUF1569 domain-containing protein n=1 Tax=Arenibacter TaxID=178469 RepID=UPI000CD42BAA|nr:MULTISPECIES: DUF1569 domain-containing protein [Arenibacter]MCM4169958.1 DUF1569 domain-containing protein [Arenibacter sp. TNZ]
MENIFNKEIVDNVISRINELDPKSIGLWGKMNVAQMLAHCNVSYEMVYTEKHPKPNGIMKLMLKLFVKQPVVNEKPYKKNSRTAPAFLIVDERDFEIEKKRLIEHLSKTQELGEGYFHNKESHSFGPLTKMEWNNLFYKHLNHHLEQFGV